MKICDELRQAVLQAAIQGKLTRQRKEDGDARDLLKQIAEEKAKLIKEKKIKKEKPLPEIAEDEVPFDIPDNWVWVRFQDCCRTLTCGYASTPKYVSENEGKAFLSAKNIKPYKFMPDNHNYIEKDLFDKLRATCKPEKGDILLTRVGAGIGEAAIIDTDLEFAIYVSLTLIKFVNNTKLFNKYVLYWLNSPIGIEAAIKNTYGKNASQGNLNVNNVRNYLIPIPPLAEQQRIVAKVEKLMAEIDELEKVENELIALKEAFPGDMKAALLQAAMQGKLTTQRKEDGNAKDLLKQITEEKARLVKEGKLKKEKPLAEISEDEILFDIPENWEWVRLNDLVVKNVKRGKSPTYSDKGRALVFAQKCNVKTGGINIELALHLDDTKLAKYPEEEYMQDADIVVNSTGTGTMGRVGLFRDTDRIGDMPIVPDSHVTVVRFGNVSTALYMYYYLKSQQEYLEENGDGSTNQKELKPLTIMNLLVPLPPLAEQERIVAKLDKLLPLVEGLKEE